MTKRRNFQKKQTIPRSCCFQRIRTMIGCCHRTNVMTLRSYFPLKTANWKRRDSSVDIPEVDSNISMFDRGSTHGCCLPRTTDRA